MVSENGLYWQSEAADEAMQDEHGFVWKAMLDTIDINLAGKRVLDAGCNRGGFLRMLSDSCGIAAGFGYDPASGAVEDAGRLTGTRPLRFEVGDTVPSGWGDFEAAFSHEVLYLLHDLHAHATAIFDALRPGCSYYAVMGVHDASPLMAEWHRANADELRLPRLYPIDEVVDEFVSAGFDAAAARLAVGFVPATGHTAKAPADAGGDGRSSIDLLRRLDYYYDDKLFLRFTRPAGR